MLFEITRRHASNGNGMRYVVTKHGAQVFAHIDRMHCESFIARHTPDNMPDTPNSVYVGGNSDNKEFARITAYMPDGAEIELNLTRGQVVDVISGLASILR